eukprot:915367-Rhodomonas_salina.1
MLIPGLSGQERQVAPYAMLLLHRYALSGTDIGYAPSRPLRNVRLRCYAIATKCPVLTQRLWCYQAVLTAIVHGYMEYAATRGYQYL